MKKFLIVFGILFFALVSCEKEELEEPGKIPGMGDTPGELEIEQPFTLPTGINILGRLLDRGESITKSGDIKADYHVYGSGKMVRLKLTLSNSKNYARTVYFRKGLVWQCKTGGFQHGLQIQTSWVCLGPNATRTIIIDLYCANFGLPAPTNTETYKILGVTGSKTLWGFLNYIKWRRVNYEMIYGSSSKADIDGPTYDEITGRFQTIVHNLTNRGISLSDDDITFIESIPELEPENIPELDDDSQYPEYFEEYIISEK